MATNVTHPEGPWTDSKVSRLRALWAGGLRTVAIGVELGLSKNAVVGKAHRLGLTARPSPIKSGESFKPARVPRPRPPKLAEILPLAVVAATPVSAARTRSAIAPHRAPQVANDAHTTQHADTERPRFNSGTDACCWPIGHPGTLAFRFCEQARLPAKPYCETHAARAYVLPTPTRNNGNRIV